MNMRMLFAGLGFLLGAVVLWCCGCAGTGVGAAASARAVRVVDLDGRRASLWEGHFPATVAVFTRTDCPVSNRYAPDVQRLCAQYQGRGVAFFLVYVDPTESTEAIRQHLREYGYTCAAVRDPQHSLVAYTHATITPEAAVFDGSGRLTYLGRINDLYVDLGQARAKATTRDLGDAIDATLEGRPVPVARTKAVGCTISDVAR
jgi:hypothetical protein